jgi:hypothetical protein
LTSHDNKKKQAIFKHSFHSKTPTDLNIAIHKHTAYKYLKQPTLRYTMEASNDGVRQAWKNQTANDTQAATKNHKNRTRDTKENKLSHGNPTQTAAQQRAREAKNRKNERGNDK